MIKLAVDFDGTLVKHRYPKIGEPLEDGIKFLISLQKNHGVKIYLDTMRSDKELQEAVDFCKEKGLEFDSVGPHKSQYRWTNSKKCHADYSIDDRNIACPVLYDEIGRPYVDWKRLIPEFQKRLETDLLMSSQAINNNPTS